MGNWKPADTAKWKNWKPANIAKWEAGNVDISKYKILEIGLWLKATTKWIECKRCQKLLYIDGWTVKKAC